MTTITRPTQTSPARPDPAARAAWRRRVARIGGEFQLAFAALWLARGTLATGWPGRLPIAIHPGGRGSRPGRLGRGHHPGPGAGAARPSRPAPRPGHHDRNRGPARSQLRAAVPRLRGRPARPHRPRHRHHHRHPAAVAAGQAHHNRPPHRGHSAHRRTRRPGPHPHRQRPDRRRRPGHRRHPGQQRPGRLPRAHQRGTRTPAAEAVSNTEVSALSLWTRSWPMQ